MKAAFEAAKAKHGASHPTTIATMNNFGHGLFQHRSKKKSFWRSLKVYPLTKTKLGADHPTTLTIGRTLALGRLAARQESKALELLSEVSAGMAAHPVRTRICTRSGNIVHWSAQVHGRPRHG